MTYAVGESTLPASMNRGLTPASSHALRRFRPSILDRIGWPLARSIAARIEERS